MREGAAWQLVPPTSAQNIPQVDKESLIEYGKLCGFSKFSTYFNKIVSKQMIKQL